MLNVSRTLAAAMLLVFAAGLGSIAIVSSANAGIVMEDKPRPDKASQNNRNNDPTRKAGKSGIQMDGSGRAIILHGKNSKSGNPAMNKQGSK